MISRQLDDSITERLRQERRRATYADVEAVPDHQVAELIDGELFVSPRPAIRHARTASRLGAKLDTTFGDDGGWVFLYEPELHFGDERDPSADVLVPDFAGWRRERLPPELINAMYLTVPPDWLCEVISPSTERLDRARKATVYARVGVSWLWFLNPIARTLEVLHLTNGQWLQVAVYSGDGEVTPDPFDLTISLAPLWSW